MSTNYKERTHTQTSILAKVLVGWMDGDVDRQGQYIYPVCCFSCQRLCVLTLWMVVFATLLVFPLLWFFYKSNHHLTTTTTETWAVMVILSFRKKISQSPCQNAVGNSTTTATHHHWKCQIICYGKRDDGYFWSSHLFYFFADTITTQQTTQKHAE